MREQLLRTAEGRFIYRGAAVRTIAKGYSIAEVAKATGEKPATIMRWARRFVEKGYEELREKPRR